MRRLISCSILFHILFLSKSYAQSLIQKGIQPEKLNSTINSSAYESHPIISPDGSTLYFSRLKHPDNTGGVQSGSDIWISELDSAKNWSLARNIGSPLNNMGNNYVSSILPDAQTVLLPNLYEENGAPSHTSGISIARKTSTGWDIPRKIEIEYFINKSKQGDFFLSTDGKVLVMAIQYYFTYGNEDLHVSFLKEDGTWSQPQNLGKEINTKFHEVSPYLASDGVTLYFSSNGHGGFGSKDIFVTRRLDDTWKSWSKPANLGKSINTAGMETSFVIPASGDYAYLVSSINSESHSDIYRVPVPQEAKPEPVILIKGKVYNAKTNQPVQAEIKYELLPEGKNVGNASSDPTTGEYSLVLPAEKNYAFYAQAAGYLSINENIDTKSLSDYKEITKDLYLVPLKIGESITLKNVFFERSTANILEESFPELDRMVKILKDNPDMEVEIGGHTDNVGKAELNVKLSEKRAETVIEYFISKGIDKNRMTGMGYGGSDPIAPNDSEENKKLNRRVEFKILKN
ncbi:MAG TPA: OmpA family protein [Cytophagales bacterium]|nr:OmpA family protein [Cytophagales bacterium]